jgi:hypothetical protein
MISSWKFSQLQLGLSGNKEMIRFLELKPPPSPLGRKNSLIVNQQLYRLSEQIGPRPKVQFFYSFSFFGILIPMYSFLP